MSSHVVVLSAALSLVTIAYYVHRWYRLRDFKGPWLASFSEIWLAKTALSGSFHNILMDTNKKYGTCNDSLCKTWKERFETQTLILWFNRTSHTHSA